jgi:hypothetical protein
VEYVEYDGGIEHEAGLESGEPDAADLGDGVKDGTSNTAAGAGGGPD